MASVKITSKGIQKVLKNYQPRLAVAEYIWNGFDAGADTVHLNFEYDALGKVTRMEIADNGKGIDFDRLGVTFNPFYDSEKAVEITAPKHTSVMHGKNGVGRLTFFTFAHTAKWLSTFDDKGTLAATEITIGVTALNDYTAKLNTTGAQKHKGTTVSFYDVFISGQEIESHIKPFLVNEFCWFLELNRDKGYAIIINGTPLDYSQHIIAMEDNIELVYEHTNTRFTIKYVQWKTALHNELSKHYFLNENNREIYKDYTTLNKKSDEFYHSVYIRSDFFNDFDFKTLEENKQASLFGRAKFSPEYKYLVKTINDYLRKKRKPYLKQYAARLMEQYQQDAIFPVYKTSEEEKVKKPLLQEVLMSLYEIQPKLFSGLNTEQKKAWVGMIDLLLNNSDGEKLMDIMDNIAMPEPDEREELGNLLKSAQRT